MSKLIESAAIAMAGSAGLGLAVYDIHNRWDARKVRHEFGVHSKREMRNRLSALKGALPRLRESSGGDQFFERLSEFGDIFRGMIPTGRVSFDLNDGVSRVWFNHSLENGAESVLFEQTTKFGTERYLRISGRRDSLGCFQADTVETTAPFSDNHTGTTINGDDLYSTVSGSVRKSTSRERFDPVVATNAISEAGHFVAIIDERV